MMRINRCHKASKMMLRIGQVESDKSLADMESARSYLIGDNNFQQGRSCMQVEKRIQNCCCRNRENSKREQMIVAHRKIREGR